MIIGIGSVQGGPEVTDTAFAAELNSVALLLIAARSEPLVIGKVAVLNPVFHVPGSLLGVDFEGVRRSTFSRKQKMLMVQVAVPDTVAASDDSGKFIFESLRETIRIAKPRFDKAKIDFDEDAFLQLVSRVEKEYALGRRNGC